MSRKLSLSLSLSLCTVARRVRISEGMLCLEIVCCADCSCRPARFEIMGTVYARWYYVCETVDQLESTHPQAVADLLAHAARRSQSDPTGSPDGSVARWAPRQA